MIRMDGSGWLSVRNRRFLRLVGRGAELGADDTYVKDVSQGRPSRSRRKPKRYPLEEGDS